MTRTDRRSPTARAHTLRLSKPAVSLAPCTRHPHALHSAERRAINGAGLRPIANHLALVDPQVSASGATSGNGRAHSIRVRAHCQPAEWSVGGRAFTASGVLLGIAYSVVASTGTPPIIGAQVRAPLVAPGQPAEIEATVKWGGQSPQTLTVEAVMIRPVWCGQRYSPRI
jgi:hypothetical protein